MVTQLEHQSVCAVEKVDEMPQSVGISVTPACVHVHTQMGVTGETDVAQL